MRFPNAESAGKFKEEYDKARDHMKALREGGEGEEGEGKEEEEKTE